MPRPTRRNRGPSAPTPETAVLDAARAVVADIVGDVDRAIETMADETMADDPTAPVDGAPDVAADIPADIDVYDPTAPVTGAPDVAAAMAASAAAIVAARAPGIATTPTVTHPRRNAPGVPDGLVPAGTWLDVPGLGDVEIRAICHRIEYDDRAPRWGNVSCSMWTPDPGVVGVMVGDTVVYPVGSHGRSSRGRPGMIREIFYHVRDHNKTMHNVAHVRVSRTRPASGPYGVIYASIIPAPAPGPAIRAIDGTV